MYGPAPRRGPKTPAEWAVLSGFLLVFLALFVAGIVGDFRPANLTAPLVLLFWIPLLALHEGGHAAAAALFGWRVERVVVGVGAAVGRFRVGTAAVEVRLLPVEGFVLCVPTRLRLPHLESALIYLAGPAVELLVAAAVVFGAGRDEVCSPSEDYGVVVWRSLAIAAACQAAMNLLPFGVVTRDRVLPSDGLGIIASLLRPTSHYAQMVGWADDVEQPEDASARTAAGRPAGQSRSGTAVAAATDWVESRCEECGQTSRFAAWKLGTVQACPHCRRSVDVGPVEDDGEWRQAGGGEEADR